MIALRQSIRENQIVYFLWKKKLYKTVLLSIHFNYECLREKKKSFSDYIIKHYEMLKMYNGPCDFTYALSIFSNIEDRISWTSFRPWFFMEIFYNRFWKSLKSTFTIYSKLTKIMTRIFLRVTWYWLEYQESFFFFSYLQFSHHHKRKKKNIEYNMSWK